MGGTGKGLRIRRRPERSCASRPLCRRTGKSVPVFLRRPLHRAVSDAQTRGGSAMRLQYFSSGPRERVLDAVLAAGHEVAAVYATNPGRSPKVVPTLDRAAARG